MKLAKETKKIGWLTIGMGAFIFIYSAIAMAIDAVSRGYADVDEYRGLSHNYYWLYEQCAVLGLFMIICGLLLTIPLIVQEKREANR